jgi:NAD(P)-dependent dehydrogenase (short-subunit alcohol dehydrogenase family)
MIAEKTVLVTGGASGIGLAVVEAALADGWQVILADVRQDSLEQCRSKLGDAGRVQYVELNVADEAAVVQALTTCGPINGLVNSAGVGSDVFCLDTSAELFRRTLEVNLIGSFLVAREVARLAIARREPASIVNIGSVSGLVGNRGRVAYGSSKGGLVTMTKVMAVELAGSGIRVNVIAPGPIETPLVAEVHTPEMRQGWLATVPQRRYGSAADIAQSALFLLDDRKSGFITGQTLSVDGGFTSAGIF